MKMDEQAIVTLDLCKTYETEDTKIEILKDVNFVVEKGQFVVVNGPSGAGKTTLLNIISGIDKPTNGKIMVLGEELGTKNEDFLATFRCLQIGFVFQSYNLISTLTVAENIAFPMEWLRKSFEQIQSRVVELLDMVGLRHRSGHFPHQLSGGEQQRVAFARALANNSPLLLADEPTGNLDADTGMKIVEILKSLKNDKTIVVATHDERIAKLADQRLFLSNGRLVSLDE